MSTTHNERSRLLADLHRLERLTSATGVMFSQAVADCVGINNTDLESMDLLNLYGPMTPGRMAELTGLSSGGVTRLIDRLERAGYVRRDADPADRRRVIIQPLWDDDDTRIAPLFESMKVRQQALAESYSTEDLQVITGFFTRATAIVQDEITRLRASRDDAGHGS